MSFLLEHTLLDAPKLPESHPGFWLEDAIIVQAFNREKPPHDKEHEDMLVKWGCDPKHESKLSIRKVDGEYHHDRLYHCMLHLRYWKEIGLHAEYVTKFETQFNFNLNDLTLPSPNEQDSGIKY
jgi:hypothetical protein